MFLIITEIYLLLFRTHVNINVCIIPLSDHSGVESVEKMEFEDLDAIKDKLTKIVPIALG